ncbi:MAG: hypothetical protein MN733_17990 [Nitrososphaera sp.]|nr:hypothetical protein [Nitrososphaera sp.]
MEKLSHSTFEEALARVASVLNATVDEVKTALDAFYRRAVRKNVGDPKPDKAVSTEIVIRPDVRPPILTGRSVCLEVEGRGPVELGRSESKKFDKSTREMVLDSKVVARRMGLKFDDDRPYIHKNRKLER